jgi:2-aminoadipate transaminase
VIRDAGATALQYGGGQGREELRELLVEVMHHEGIPATPTTWSSPSAGSRRSN